MASILIVEDDEDTREILRMAMEQIGHTVMDTGDGKQALALMKASSVSLVTLLDLRLDGIRDNPVIKAMEVDPTLAQTHRVIVVTAMVVAQAEEAVRPIRSSLAGFVTKPFDLSNLLSVVAQATAQITIVV